MEHLPQKIPVNLDTALMDADALKVISRLKRYGFEAYMVGGCVRDLLLGEPPKDFDLATSAKPQELRRVFRNCRIIGRRFRLAHIFFANNKIVEVATFRSTAGAPEAPEVIEPGDGADGSEGNNGKETTKNSAERDLLIRDDNVFGNAESDALRRDFTVNALFYDPEKREVIDYVGGFADLQNRRLVSIGDPWIRFREDPVRIIRAAKFSASLGLTLDEHVREAMLGLYGEIVKSSPSRVVEEVFKILNAKGVSQTFLTLQEIGLLQFVLPELAQAAHENPAGFWNYLRALEWGRSGKKPDYFQEQTHIPEPPRHLRQASRAIRFLALMTPMFQDEVRAFLDGHMSHPLRREGENKVHAAALALRNPRRDTFRAKQIFLAQERLNLGAFPRMQHFQKKGRRKRPLGAANFVTRPYFSEALQYMWICAVANPEQARWSEFGSWLQWEDLPPGEQQDIPRHHRSPAGAAHGGAHATHGGHGGQGGHAQHNGQDQDQRGPRRRRRRRRGGKKFAAPEFID